MAAVSADALLQGVEELVGAIAMGQSLLAQLHELLEALFALAVAAPDGGVAMEATGQQQQEHTKGQAVQPSTSGQVAPEMADDSGGLTLDELSRGRWPQDI